MLARAHMIIQMYAYCYHNIFVLSADQVCPSTSKRWKSRSGQKIRKERPTSEEGPLPPKSLSSKKQQKGDFSTKKALSDEPAATTPSDDDQSSAKETTHTTVERAGESSLTKLIGKAMPFTSDISSSESDSELPAEGGKVTKQKEEIPLLPSQQKGEDEGAGEREDEEEEEEEEGVEKDGVCVKRERKDDDEKQTSVVKEEASVKIYDNKEERHATPG